MSTTFALEEIYGKIFRIGPEEKKKLREAAGNLWDGFPFIEEDDPDPIRIVSIGYGSGWRDLPVLLALRDILEERANAAGRKVRGIHVRAIEPEWTGQQEYSDGELVWVESPPHGAFSNSTKTPLGVLKGIKSASGIQIELFVSFRQACMKSIDDIGNVSCGYNPMRRAADGRESEG